jgi:hypothetical protein
MKAIDLVAGGLLLVLPLLFIALPADPWLYIAAFTLTGLG